MRRFFPLAILFLSMGAWADVELSTPQLNLLFADNGDLLSAEACLPDCSSPDAHRKVLPGVLAFTSFATEEFTLVRASTDGGQILDFTDAANGTYRRWTVPATGYRLELAVRGAERLDLSAGDALRPPADAAGFGEWLEEPRYVEFSEGDVVQFGIGESETPDRMTDWTGFRGRFWAVVARPGEPLDVSFTGQGLDPAMVLAPEPAREARLSLYIGPVEPHALARSDPELEGLMYAGLWFWLRWICQALYGLLGWIHALVPHWAAAIALLSVTVGILMQPLSRIADRLQAQVQRTEAMLAPELAAIKREFKGGEQSERIIALYRKHGVHPLYSLKSLAGVAVVIPVFIGAFDMLAENIWLSGEPFWWIADLARPDRLAALPFTIPFFGNQFNALPFVMTAFSVWASSIHRVEVMDGAALRRHRINLAVMALAFLLLFYTFPAGMVLYWTANNALSVIKYAWRNRRTAGRDQQAT